MRVHLSSRLAACGRGDDDSGAADDDDDDDDIFVDDAEDDVVGEDASGLGGLVKMMTGLLGLRFGARYLHARCSCHA